MNYVGIDIHKRYSVLAAQDGEGRRLKEARIQGNSAEEYARFFQSLRSEVHTSELQSPMYLVSFNTISLHDALPIWSGNMKAVRGSVSFGKKERNCFYELRRDRYSQAL